MQKEYAKVSWKIEEYYNQLTKKGKEINKFCIYD